MRNEKERKTFINNDSNWSIVAAGPNIRILIIECKGEKRQRLDVNEWTYCWDSKKGTEGFKHQSKWITRNYYIDRGDSLEPQSLTDIRKWVADLDRKYPDQEVEG